MASTPPPAGAKTSISSLPLELFELILDSLPPDRYKEEATLALSSRVAKYWTDPCCSRLYRNLDIYDSKRTALLAQSDALLRYPRWSLKLSDVRGRSWENVETIIMRSPGLKVFAVMLGCLFVPPNLFNHSVLRDVQTLHIDCEFDRYNADTTIAIPFRLQHLIADFVPDQIPLLRAIANLSIVEERTTITRLSLTGAYNRFALAELAPIATSLVNLELTDVEVESFSLDPNEPVLNAAEYLRLATCLDHFSVAFQDSGDETMVHRLLKVLLEAVVAPLKTVRLGYLAIPDYGKVLEVLEEAFCSLKGLANLREFRLEDNTAKRMKARSPKEWIDFTAKLAEKKVKLVLKDCADLY